MHHTNKYIFRLLLYLSLSLSEYTLCMHLSVFVCILLNFFIFFICLLLLLQFTQIHTSAGTRDFIWKCYYGCCCCRCYYSSYFLCSFRSSSMFFLFTLIGYCPLFTCARAHKLAIFTLSYSHIEHSFLFHLKCVVVLGAQTHARSLAMHKLYARLRPKPNSIKTAISAQNTAWASSSVSVFFALYF